MIEAVIYFVVSSVCILYLYRKLRDDIPEHKKKKVLFWIVLVLVLLSMNIILHLVGVFK